MDTLFPLPLEQGLFIAFLAFLCEYIDSAIGMGYGTIMSPVLLMMGFEPLQVVPTILFSELVTGFGAGFTHHQAGNVDFRPRTMNITRIYRGLKEKGLFKGFDYGIPIHLKIVLLLGLCSIFGTVLAVFLATALPTKIVKIYIGTMIFCIGLFVLVTMRINFNFSWKRVTALGLISSFNKGISGGGYGPVVTGGQLLAGVDPRNTIGITSLSEALTCVGGVALYYFGGKVDWILAPYMVTGAVLSLPFAALSVKVAKRQYIRYAVGLLTVVLGIASLIQVL